VVRKGGGFSVSPPICLRISLSVCTCIQVIERSTVRQYDQHPIATRISVTILLNPDTTSAEIEAITEQYLHHDEDGIPDRHAEPSIISMSEHVSESISAGLTSSTGIANDLESTDEGDMISIQIQIIFLLLQDLTFYFQSLSVSSLPAVPRSSPETNISDLIKSLSRVQRSLTQHLDAHKTQSQLDSWLQRSA